MEDVGEGPHLILYGKSLTPWFSAARTQPPLSKIVWQLFLSMSATSLFGISASVMITCFHGPRRGVVQW